MEHAINWFLTFKGQDEYDTFREDPMCDDIVLNHQDPTIIEDGKIKWEVRLKKRVWKSTFRLLLKEYPDIDIAQSKAKRKKRGPPKGKSKDDFNLQKYAIQFEKGKTVQSLFIEAKSKANKEEFIWLSLHEQELLQLSKCMNQYSNEDNSIPIQNKVIRSRSRSREKDSSNKSETSISDISLKRRIGSTKASQKGEREIRMLCENGNVNNLENHVKILIANKFPEIAKQYKLVL